MSVLAIVAHPDDASLICGGTLLKHSERGHKTKIIYMTRGEYGSIQDREESEVAEQREEEASNSSGILESDCSFLDFKDGRIEYTLANRKTIMNKIRINKPNYIITHSNNDPHPDHRITSKLVSDAYYQASLPMVESDQEPFDPVNVFYFDKPGQSTNFDCYVDISDLWERKEKAIRAHESQLQFLDKHGGVDQKFDNPISAIRAQNRILGRECGVKYAEAFKALHQSAGETLEEF